MARGEMRPGLTSEGNTNLFFRKKAEALPDKAIHDVFPRFPHGLVPWENPPIMSIKCHTCDLFQAFFQGSK